MTRATRAFAPAKINLTLHVTGKRADGYHMLDSLVAFADVGDELSVRDGTGLTLDVTGPRAKGVPCDHSNSILQAAMFLGQDDLAFSLHKTLPSAAGIGGGTSDAAAALRAMADLRGLDIPEGLEALGADVPVCALCRVARMSGIGDVVAPVAPLPALWAVLVNPGVSVPTPKIFKALVQKDNAPMPEPLPTWRSVGQLCAWLADQRNDLEAPALQVQPVIGDVLKALSELPGVRLARMSGSGATCFALFDDRGLAEIGAKIVQETHPDWWVVDCALS